MKFAARLLPAPSMFCGVTVGLPGRCLPMWRATTRAHRSYPPPVPKPMIMFTVLPAKTTAGDCAAACPTAITAARSPAGSVKAIACLVMDRSPVLAGPDECPAQDTGLVGAANTGFRLVKRHEAAVD